MVGDSFLSLGPTLPRFCGKWSGRIDNAAIARDSSLGMVRDSVVFSRDWLGFLREKLDFYALRLTMRAQERIIKIDT